MRSYEETLNDAVLDSFGRVLDRYDTLSQDTALLEIGRLVAEYLHHNGFETPAPGPVDDFSELMGFYRRQGQTPEPDEHDEDRSIFAENQRLVELVASQADELVASLQREFEARSALHTASERLRKQEIDRQAATGKIKILHGLLPICSFCRNIRTEDGHWQQLERYIIDRSEATFTHGACPDCFGDYYGDYAALDRKAVTTWASANQKIKMVIDPDNNITIVRLENGYETADGIAALDRIYREEATAGILWDFTEVKAIDFDNIERDANYRIDRVLRDYRENRRRRKRTAYVFDARADRMRAALDQTVEIFRSRAPTIEFALFTDTDSAMAWVTQRNAPLP